MNPITSIQAAVSKKWTGLFVRLLAVVLLYGAGVHISNMLGLIGRPWSELPTLWRVMDVVLLVFNLTVAGGLWRRRTWGVLTFFLGLVCLQIIPYTIFQHQFVETAEDVAILHGLVGTELILLAVLAILIVLKK